MVQAGDEIENPVTEERIVFLRTSADTDGELLELDDFWSRSDHRVAEHIHPEMEERWEVIDGTVRFQVAGVDQTAGSGDVVVAPAGTTHASWNVGDGPAHLRIQMRPALRWEDFVVSLFAAARDGRTDDQGVPEPALMLELLREFHRELSPPPS
jgi:mannose-6-phosphate isomerase-like protein (cupin superfamily)